MTLDDEITKAIVEDDCQKLNFYTSKEFPVGSDENGDPWIRVAVDLRSCDSIKWMISKGVELNLSKTSQRYNDGHTLLTLCVDGCLSDEAKNNREIQENYLKIVRLLVAAGCDLNEEGWQLMAPLHYAIFGHNTEIAKELLSLGADPNVFCSVDNMGTAYDVAKEENMMHVFDGYKRNS